MNDRTCPWWLGYFLASPLRRIIQHPEKMLAPFVREGMTVMDLGCGMGFFSLALASLVGARGTVICVDLQQEMLDGLKRRAEKAGLLDRIRLQRATPDDMMAAGPVDFTLVFWMAHEVADVRRFLGQVHKALKPDGIALLVEPLMHVPLSRFQEIIEHARRAGFVVDDAPSVKISRSTILRKSI